MATTEYGSKPKAKKGKAQAPKNERVDRYLREMERYKRATEAWYAEGEQIESFYLDESSLDSERRAFPLLWANIETLKPAVYAKIPTVLCSRRYKDKDPIARTCAELMERATNTSFDLYAADETFRMVRDDRLLPGRGQAWVRYEATIEKTEVTSQVVNEETGEEVEETEVSEKVTSEKVCVDYVHWKDFGHNISRVWKETWLVWRVVYKTQEEAAERFGGEAAAKLTYIARAPNGTPEGKDSSAEGADNRARIYEFWDKHDGTVSWYGEGMRDFLETGEPPMSFRGFFPCPEPCYATKTSKQLVPVPDYRYYRDQAKEINDLTEKIHNLTQWLIVKGFVPSGPSTVADTLEEAIRDKSNSELFQPVESMKEWGDRGGASKLIDWMPIDQVVKALTAAIQARNQLIQDVFQLTGISDILRGQTDPNETLGAQELKAQTGSRRLKNTRDDLARWCKDIALLCAEVIAEQFSPETIADITGFKYVPMQQQPMMALPGPMGMLPPPAMPGAQLPVPMSGAPPATMLTPSGIGSPDVANDGAPESIFTDEHIELLRNDKLRSFRIDVETDQTMQADENLEKQRNTELLQALGTVLREAVEVIAAAPPLTPVYKEFLLMTARKFRAGKAIEEELERAFDAAQKQAQAARQQQKTSPEEVAAQQKMLQSKQDHEANMVALEKKTMAEMALRDKDMQAKNQEMAFARETHDMKMQEISRQVQMDIQRENIRRVAHDDEQKAKAADRQHERETSDLKHRYDMATKDREFTRQEEAHWRSLTEEGSKRAAGESDRKASDAKTDKILQEIRTLMAALAAPRRVQIERGPDGKAMGAVTKIGG